MDKTELIEALAVATGLPKASVSRSVDALVSTVVKTLREEERVTISGLGSFSVVKMAARVGRNPRTGAPVRIPPRKAIKFRPMFDLEEEEW